MMPLKNSGIAGKMTHAQYNLWLATWNAGLKAGLSTSEALAQADKIVSTMKE